MNEPTVLKSLKHYRRLRAGAILRPADRRWSEPAQGWICTIAGGTRVPPGSIAYYRRLTPAQISAERRQRKDPS